MPKTAEEFLELMQHPETMTREDARELSGYLKLIERKGENAAEDEKRLSDVFREYMEAYSAQLDTQAEQDAKMREAYAEKHFSDLMQRGSKEYKEKQKNKTAEELAENPFDIDREFRLERGRHIGKGRIEYLAESCRPMAGKDPDLDVLLGKMTDYVHRGANASRLSGGLKEETEMFGELCSLSDAFLKKQEDRQLTEEGDTEEGIRLLTAAEEISRTLQGQRLGELDTAVPYRVPVRADNGQPAWEEMEPLTVNSSGAFIRMKAKKDRNDLVKTDKELDKLKDPLFPHDPSPQDIVQGRLGDCYLLAGLSSLAASHPEKIRQMMTDNDDGTVTVRFFKKEIDSETNALRGYRPILVTVDKTVPDYSGAQNCLWVSMIERAYAAAELHTANNAAQNPTVWTQDAADTYYRLKRINTNTTLGKDNLEQEIRDTGARELYPFLFGKNGELREDADTQDYTMIESGVTDVFLEQVLGPEGEGENISIENLMTDGAGRGRNQNGSYQSLAPDAQKIDTVRRMIEKARADGVILNAGTYGKSDTIENNGIYQRHAYSVLDIGKKTVAGHEDIFVTLRNPHGTAGRRYVDKNGTLTPEEWKTEGGVFDVRLEDFCCEFRMLCVNHTEKTVMPEPERDPIRGKYMSVSSAYAYGKALQEMEETYRDENPVFGRDREFETIGNLVTELIRSLNETQGKEMKQAADSYQVQPLRRAVDRYLTANGGSGSPKRTEIVRTTKDWLDAMEQGYLTPADYYRERLAEKLMRGEAEVRSGSADPQEQAEGAALQALFDPARKKELAAAAAERARRDVTVGYLMKNGTFSSIRAMLGKPDAELYGQYRSKQAAAQAEQDRKQAQAAARVRAALPDSMTKYGSAFREIRASLLDTDRFIRDSRNSPEYRALREALKTYIDSLNDPALRDKTRRECADTEAARALRQACADYRAHCDATPGKKNRSRRVKRVGQLDALEHLMDAMEKNVYDDPRDYMRMKLSERAARGLQMFYSEAEDPAAAAEGERQKALLDGPASRERDMLIINRYGEPGFREWSGRVTYGSLAGMMRMPEKDIMRLCCEKRLAWEAKHPDREKRLEKNQSRRLYELMGGMKEPIYLRTHAKKSAPAGNQPASPAQNSGGQPNGPQPG